ncbi:uncharacterized protein K452DRAFT_283623 [Aplosporella prunicola CBS 121167]|uniref:Rho-GAP domain-containing protein n=1 Tax=Aplosporella prunicola CBS 121167 TaxID=1176127 RepID=A0A6A6BSV3_9PEZI|nr:uncharacterized protein K452DRAFT_283623 [Aplosporella prunicola CBS 121167]KAF2146345.1 hypothetical protein K452DRAFT_283623 [Aplosporella prunicola CBS 121167]
MDPSHDLPSPSGSTPNSVEHNSNNNNNHGPAFNEPITKVDEVLYSDIGLTTLLTRLKQSIASARDFSGFLNKRSRLEEEQAQGIKKLCRSTHESLRRNEVRQGTYAAQFEEATRLHERMGENGMQFALSLHQMHEDLNELCSNMEKGRKTWKQTGLSNEKKVSDAIAQMEKAKSKYDSLAEDYDKVRTGDKSAGRVFGIKGPKSAQQHEEDLHRKLQAADQDYAAKVQNAQMLRQELVDKQRPEAVSALLDLTKECDAAVALQLQKFASFNEKLILGNGILVAPLNNPGEPPQSSLRDIVYRVDNEKDFQSYIRSQSSKVTSPPIIMYKQHPTLAPPPQPSATPVHTKPPQLGPIDTGSHMESQPQQQSGAGGSYLNYDSAPGQSLMSPQDGPKHNPYSSPTRETPPYPMSSNPPYNGSSDGYGMSPPKSAGFGGPVTNASSYANAPPIKPVFGITLEELFHRDGTPVPMVVYQCIQAVDLFGLDAEGIYRVPGTNSHIQAMKAMFDHDSEIVDFRNPEAFFHDVNSVAGLLKQFFRDLPDPLLTQEHYEAFIDSARIDDDIVRRDSLHAIINALPDPNYATLRALVLHLNRVQDRSASNRMSTTNLAICFAPSLMGPHRGQMADAGLQAKVVDTILVNTYQIFDED